jgi:hypothetical protein
MNLHELKAQTSVVGMKPGDTLQLGPATPGRGPE